MTVRALLGLAVANLVVLGAGTCLLWGVRGLRSWAEVARLSGLAYTVGVAALGVASTIELVVGLPFGVVTILLTCLALAVAGLWQHVVAAVGGGPKGLRRQGRRPWR